MTNLELLPATHADTPRTVEIDLPTPEVEVIDSPEQRLRDRFQELHALSSEMQRMHPSTGVSREDGDRLNLIKWGVEEITYDVLPQTQQFRSAQRGAEVDSSMTGVFFSELSQLRLSLEGKAHESTTASVFERVDPVVIQSFNELLENAPSKAQRTYYGGEDAIFDYLGYAGVVGRDYLTDELVSNLRHSNYRYLLAEPRLAEVDPGGDVRLHAFRQNLIEIRKVNGKGTVEAKAPVVSMLSEYGFTAEQADDILMQWLSSRQGAAVETQVQNAMESIHDNLHAIQELSGIDPSLPQTIYRRFGIRNFGRYSTEELLLQMEPNYRPNAIAVSATADWNDAFKRFPEHVSHLSDRPLFVEVKSNTELARRFINIRDAGIPVRRIVVGAHGRAEGMRWGRRADDRLTLETVQRSTGLRRLVDRGLIRPDTQLVLVSCSTGEEGGVGQGLSFLPGIGSVQAPDFISKGIKGVEADGRVVYGNDDAEGGESVGKIYKNNGSDNI